MNLPSIRALFSAMLLVLACMALHGTACAEDTKTPPAKKDPKTMSLDELEAAGLCPVKKIESKQIYHYDLNGKTYHFCCRECQDEFEAHPEKYGAKADKPKDPAPEPKK